MLTRNPISAHIHAFTDTFVHIHVCIYICIAYVYKPIQTIYIYMSICIQKCKKHRCSYRSRVPFRYPKEAPGTSYRGGGYRNCWLLLA